ncbi:MAG: sodium:solute symporter family protein [Verrucomicrobiae bacterium]|nr:sodium:solute symporter family protein [Verrucomicrobiae bacterium]
MNPVLIGLAGFILVQLAIGLVVSRRIRNTDDYWLAGRTMGFWLIMPSVFATWFGAETCVSSAGGMYERGLAGGAAEPFGYGLCIVFLGAVFAVPLYRRGLTTFADFYRTRFSPGVEKVAVIILAPTSILWAAAQVRAFGQVVSSAAGMNVELGITVAAGVAIAYTFLGGLRADVITDCLQAGIIIVGLAVLAVLIVHDQGGVSATLGLVERERFTLFGGGMGFWETAETWAVPVCGSGVAQEIISRILAARSANVARSATITGGVAYLLIGTIPACIGLVGFALLPDLRDPEQILPQLAQTHLPQMLYILFIGALVSAILSTVDSSLLAASALLSQNLVLPLCRQAGDRARLWTARSAVVLCGLAAFGLALSAETIYGLVEAASAFGGAGLFVLLVFGLFTRLGRARTALFTLLASAVTWVIAGPLLESTSPYVTSMGVATLVYVGVSAWDAWRKRLALREAAG